jgi:hypothetical protein
MLSISGRIVNKSTLKSGDGEFGKWKIIQFVIAKTYAKKKVKIAFTAKGKWADFIDSVPKNEKIRIEFIPDCFYSEKNSRYFTELRVISVEKWMPRKYFNSEVLNPVDLEITKDLQLKF